MPCARYYVMHFMYILSGPHLWGRYTNLQLRTLRNVRNVFFLLSSIPGTDPTNYLAPRTETGSRPWFLLCNPVNVSLTRVTGHPNSIINVGVKFKRWSVWWKFLHSFCHICHACKESQGHGIIWYPMGQSAQGCYSKCWLFCKFIQYMLVWSWMQAQSLAQDTTLSTRFQLPNVSTGISHAYLKLTCAKQDSWSSPQILLLPSFLLGRSQDLAPSITWYSSQKLGSCLWHVPPLLYPNHHQHIHLHSKNNTNNNTY